MDSFYKIAQQKFIEITHNSEKEQPGSSPRYSYTSSLAPTTKPPINIVSFNQDNNEVIDPKNTSVEQYCKNEIERVNSKSFNMFNHKEKSQLQNSSSKVVNTKND